TGRPNRHRQSAVRPVQGTREAHQEYADHSPRRGRMKIHETDSRIELDLEKLEDGDEEECIAALLLAGVLFPLSRKTVNPFNDKIHGPETLVLCVIANDLF